MRLLDSRLLAVPPLVLLPELAAMDAGDGEEVGLEAAIVLQQLYWLCEVRPGCDGWTALSYAQFEANLRGAVKERALRRIVPRLVKCGLLTAEAAPGRANRYQLNPAVFGRVGGADPDRAGQGTQTTAGRVSLLGDLEESLTGAPAPSASKKQAASKSAAQPKYAPRHLEVAAAWIESREGRIVSPRTPQALAAAICKSLVSLDELRLALAWADTPGASAYWHARMLDLALITGAPRELVALVADWRKAGCPGLVAVEEFAAETGDDDADDDELDRLAGQLREGD